ncbi:MAG: hypothetical protein KDD55_01015 [Bdellovibrionales bacterium]|nr:hypothetical protein [Bdellovibrionales bacterium]
MLEISHDMFLIAIGAIAALFVLQAFVALYLLSSLRSARKERAALHREIYGLVRKLEGLTSGKREQMAKQFDKILSDLALRLPPTIAAQAGQTIFETESRILSRLAELEPDLKNDHQSREKMDDLIKSMEALETTIVTVTADTVQNIMASNRQAIFDDELFSEEIAA